MNPIDKPRAKSRTLSHSDKVQTSRVRITFVSDKEREQYRIPSYGYILP